MTPPPDAAVTVTGCDLADPFTDITTAATGSHISTKAVIPHDTRPPHTSNLDARYSPWQATHSNQGDSLPWETITLGTQPTTRAHGSNKPYLIEVTGRYSNCPDLLEQLRRVATILSDGAAWRFG